MFNDNKKKLVSAGAATLALAVTLGYAAVANAQISASVSKPVLRQEYLGADSIQLDESINLARGKQKISVSLRDSDLKQALRMIADKAGLNVIFHSSVEGTITLDLVNVTLNDAFKMIMQASDLSFYVDKGTLVVMSQEAATKSDIAKQNMMTLPVKYADSAKIADFLNSNIFTTNRPGLSNNKIVVTNPVTNELIIFGTSNDYKMAQKVVAKLDVPPKTLSYRVNHTTPKEMATLICDSLFPTAVKGKASGAKGGNGTESENGDSEEGGLGSGLQSGSLTGGASSLGGSSSSGSSGSGGLSSSSDSSSNANNDISLGEGVVACTVKGKVSANKLSSLDGSSLTVTYFPQKGTINIIGGSDYQGEMIKNFIKDNDKKQPQAYVEMQIVELSEKGSKTFNNEWTLLTPFFSAQFTPDRGLSNFENTRTFFTGHPYAITTNTGSGENAQSSTVDYIRWHGPKTLAWGINYIIESGKGRLLANPKVMVTNGKMSKIDLTSDYIKSTDEEIMTAGFGTSTAGVSRTYEIGDDAGISVELTPFISPDGYITMNIKPNYATIKETKYSPSSTGSGDIIAATLLQRRNIELSNIRIKDGETLVIGGLIQEEETKSVSKIPILGDLPGIGGVFRNTKTSNEKAELIIMLTPRIIKDTEDVASGVDNL